MQLVNKNVHMVDPIKNKLISEKEVKEKFGVYPEKVIDVQSLAGDSVDNIPGAPGIGLKTGAQLINEFSSLEENLLTNYSKIKPQNKRRETIEKNIEAIRISKELVTLKNDIQLDINIDKISECKINIDKLIPFLDSNNFNNLKARVLNKTDENFSENKDQKTIKLEYQSIQDDKSFSLLLKNISKCNVLAIDTETDSLKSLKQTLSALVFPFLQRR